MKSLKHDLDKPLGSYIRVGHGVRRTIGQSIHMHFKRIGGIGELDRFKFYDMHVAELQHHRPMYESSPNR